jgi:large subunit ribosomal protein L29
MKEITELSMDELLTKRRDLRQESLHLRLQQQSGQLEQPSRLRLLRRDLARLETVLSQRGETDRKEVELWLSKINHSQQQFRRSPSP